MSGTSALNQNHYVFRLAITEATKIIRLVAKSKKFLRAEATGLKNLHNALIAAGFTEDQATTIVAHQGLRTFVNLSS